MPSGGERASELAEPAHLVDPLIAHGGLGVEGREALGQRHAHVVGPPRRATEVVDRQRLFDLDAIVLELGGDRGFAHDERRTDVARDRVHVQHHPHRLHLPELERRGRERAAPVPRAHSVRDVARSLETREHHCAPGVGRSLNVLPAVALRDRVDQNAEGHDLALHGVIVRIAELDGDGAGSELRVFLLEVFRGLEDAGHSSLASAGAGARVRVRIRVVDGWMPLGQRVVIGTQGGWHARAGTRAGARTRVG